jgi:hypothetical protein
MPLHTLLPIPPLSILALAAVAVLAAPAAAEETHLSVMLQNDAFAGNDGGGYTNGIALSRLRTAAPGETSIRPQWLLAPLAPWMGLGPATLALSSLNQIMVTPKDITRAVPDPADAPYLGALWFRAAQVSVQGEIADMLAIDLGMIGPASGARQSQVFIHHLTNSDRPQGWDRQVPNRPLAGIDRYRAVRYAFGDALERGPAADVILLGGGTLSSMQSSLGGSVLLRYGTGLKRSYPTALRQAARGGDPSVLGRGWFVYTGLHADRMFSHLGIGDDRPVQGGTAKLRESQVLFVGGLAYGWDQASLSFSLQSSSSLTTSTSRRKEYGSLTYATRWK